MLIKRLISFKKPFPFNFFSTYTQCVLAHCLHCLPFTIPSLARRIPAFFRSSSLRSSNLPHYRFSHCHFLCVIVCAFVSFLYFPFSIAQSMHTGLFFFLPFFWLSARLHFSEKFIWCYWDNCLEKVLSPSHAYIILFSCNGSGSTTEIYHGKIGVPPPTCKYLLLGERSFAARESELK